jgi:antitoxin HicB
MKNKYKGSTFDSFLEKEGLLEQVEATAVKRVVAFQIEKAMQQQQISKKQMAEGMQTSRSSLDRLLDPENTAVTLISLVKAAHVLGKKVRISLVKG